MQVLSDISFICFWMTNSRRCKTFKSESSLLEKDLGDIYCTKIATWHMPGSRTKTARYNVNRCTPGDQMNRLHRFGGLKSGYKLRNKGEQVVDNLFNHSINMMSLVSLSHFQDFSAWIFAFRPEYLLVLDSDYSIKSILVTLLPDGDVNNPSLLM